MKASQKNQCEALVFMVEYFNQRSSGENWSVPQKNIAEDREAIATASALLGHPLEAARSGGTDPLCRALSAASIHLFDCLENNRDEDHDVQALEDTSAALQGAEASVISALEAAASALAAAERRGRNRPDWIEGYETWVEDMGLGDDDPDE